MSRIAMSQAAFQTATGPRDTYQAERRNTEDQEQSLKAVQLHRKNGEHDEQHHRYHSDDGGLRFLALLHRAGYNKIW
jgi:hypothetical protein